ncbi:MAG: phosphoribosyl-AMP cyclohydrolase [Armatimonadota bacterium]|jgi:phosphoribosyl-AMP cyclohydrolase
MTNETQQPLTLDDLTFDGNGLIPAVVQDHETLEVLMVAYMNRQSLEETIATGLTHFWSRSRQQYWEKGGTSGNVQRVKSIYTDICDRDTLIVRVEQVGGAACHEGYRSCFSLQLQDDGSFAVVGERVFDPETVYGRGE